MNIKTVAFPPSRKDKLTKASLKIAADMVREKIDGEGKFVPGALYELTGEHLREYLAFAFREGTKYGTTHRPKAQDERDRYKVALEAVLENCLCVCTADSENCDLKKAEKLLRESEEVR